MQKQNLEEDGGKLVQFTVKRKPNLGICRGAQHYLYAERAVLKRGERAAHTGC